MLLFEVESRPKTHSTRATAPTVDAMLPQGSHKAIAKFSRFTIEGKEGALSSDISD